MIYETNNGNISVNQAMGNTNASIFKFAYAFKVNDFGGSLNAGTVSTDTSGLPALAVDRMGIGFDYGANATNTGLFKKITYYPARVTNAQLQALTS